VKKPKDWTDFWKNMSSAPKNGEPILAKVLPIGGDLILTSNMTNQEFDNQFYTTVIKWNSYCAQWTLYIPSALDTCRLLRDDISVNPLSWMPISNFSWKQTAEIAPQGLDQIEKCHNQEEVKSTANDIGAELVSLLLINQVMK
jgi:hypothetical protein